MLKSFSLSAFVGLFFLTALVAPDAAAECFTVSAAHFLSPPPAQVVAYEYWFDQEHDQRTFVAVSPAEELSLDLDLPTTGLSNGLHTLHVRFLDDQDQWSGVVSQFFTKLPPAQGGDRQIVTYQYWFDNASAQAVEVPITPASEITVLTDLPTPGLANGLHTLHLRFRDDGGQWSGIVTQFFTKLPPAQSGDRQIVAYQYWFDNASAQAVEVPITPASEIIVLTDLPTTGLANGLHTLHLRFRDDAGQWNGVVSQFFTKLPPAQSGDRQIVAYQYWFDNASAQAVEVPVTPASEITVLTDLPTTGLANGLHTFHLRFRDDAGQWSGIVTQFFTKLPPAQSGDRQIVAYQYWFDNAPAQAVDVPVTPGSEITVLTDLPTMGLANGLHSLHLRFRDNAGQWSGVVSQFFTKLAAQNTDNKIAGYRYWLDLNFAGAVTVVLLTPVDVLILDEDLDFSALPPAPHVLHMQFYDLNGAWSAVTSDTFNVGLPPQASFTPQVVPCKNGQVKFNNTSSYATSWLWNFGDGNTSTQAMPTHTYTAPGTYSVTLTATDGTNGSTSTFTANAVAEFRQLNISASATPASCFNSNDGTATATASNGQGPFTYNWSNGQMGETISSLYPGNYTVTVISAEGCSATATATVANGSNLAVSIFVIEQASCLTAANGQAQVNALNGAPPYSYLWSNGETGSTATQLAAGPISATVTDAAGCMLTANATMGYSSGFSASLVVTGLNTCPDSEDGQAQVNVQNGTPPYSYLWSNGETASTAEHLAVGSIGATVTGADGCAVSASAYMGHSSDLTASIDVLENPGCPDSEDGRAQIVPQGGISPFTYLWSNGETTGIAEQLPAGNASATLTDANGCSTVALAYLTPPEPLTANPVVQHVACFGDATGSAEMIVTNGTPPYSIAWTTGATGVAVSNLAAGQYGGTITDANGCQASVAFTVQEPAVLTVQVSHTDVTCAFFQNGTATAVAGGGTPPLTVLWSNGATDFNISNLPPDHYIATATDANGCTAVSNDAWVTQPAALSLTLAAEEAPCGVGGSITTTVGGGTPPYEFDWNNGATVQNQANLPAGNYYVVVTDANDCVATASAAVPALGHAPNFTYSGNPGFESQIVDPPGGSPYQTYRFEVRYSDAEGDLPQAGYPRLYLDFEGDGNLFGGNDQSYVLTGTNPADQDVLDGKDYFAAITGIPPGPNYKMVVRAFDAGGCQGDWGPFDGPGVVDATDIFLFANDIQFSNSHPNPLDTIEVTATVHNESDFPAENFDCRLSNLNTGQIFAPLTVPLLSAHSTTQVTWTVVTPPDASWNPMKVEIDATHLIAEPNELDNQAIRPYVNGDYNLPGSIAVTAAVQPDPSILAPLASLHLSGSAVYEDTAIPLTDPGCAGASVVFNLAETGQTFAGFTDEHGDFSIYFPQPLTAGTYHIAGTVTDYTLEGNFSATFTVTPLPCVKPDLICQLELDQYSLVQDQSTGGKIRVTNAGTAPSMATRVQMTCPGASPQSALLNVPPLDPGAYVDIPLPSLTFPSVGTTFLQAVTDFEYLNDECHENNNSSTVTLSITPALPDIAPAQWSPANSSLPLCGNHAFTYRINNKGGAATGPFFVKWEVWKDGVMTHDSSLTIGDIPAGGAVYISFPYTFPASGDYLLALTCDEPNAVAEYSESNNNVDRTVHLYTCPVGADLAFGGCQELEVTPADPDGSGSITVTTTLSNKGNTVAVAPFTVRLLVEQSGPGAPPPAVYLLTIADDLALGQSIPVSFTIPQPAAGGNTLSLTADADEQVDELNENNNQADDALDWNFSLGSFCCSSCMFWEKPVTTSNLWFSAGLFNGGQYEASSVEVMFEISGPGLNGWVNLGNAVVNAFDKTCNCPAGAGLPNPFTFPGTGTYTVRMTADPGNVYPESDETDNVLIVQVSVRPDMRVLSQFIAPSELHPDPGEPLLFTVSYENTGFSNPADTMELFLMVDGFPLDSARVPGLLPGDHYSVQFPTPWSSNVVGQHAARAIIDRDADIVESDESNNEATRALVVGEAPNFRFAGFAPNDNHPVAGQALAVVAQIENNGDLTGAGTYQLYYTNDAGDLVLLLSKSLTLTAGQQQTVSFVWPVLDAQTVLVGKIINTNPLEVRYDDNEAHFVLGGLDLSVSTTPEVCIPYTGTATAAVSGGTPPYFYGWVTGQLGANVDGLGAGNYSLTVTDANGLSAVAYFAVAHKPQPELTFTVTEASCDKNDGAVSLQVAYGIAPLDIAWSTGAVGATSLSGLVPALYRVSVTDALGCHAEKEVVVGFDALKAGADGDCEVAYPMIGLEKGIVNTGETQTMDGKLFFPNGQVVVIVSGPQGELVNTQLPTGADGTFGLTFAVPAGTPVGQYTASVRDEVSGFPAPEKNFEVIDPTPPATDGLRITSPLIAGDVNSCTTQTVEWEERIVRTGIYPYSGHYRHFRYIVEMSRISGQWEYLGKDEGYASFGSSVHRSFDYEVPKPGTTYRIRVRDFYDAGNEDVSAELQTVVSPVAGNCMLEWDYSYLPRPNGHPKGVAADGTARVYLNVGQPGLVSAKVTLSDLDHVNPSVTKKDTATLGRVMVATVTDQYSDEANAANDITDEGTPGANGKLYFWYVAPDDFVRESADASAGKRYVYVILELTFQNSSSLTTAVPVEIVRPPLMLVHGLGGSPDTWDEFKSTLSGKLLIDDERFLVKKAVQIGRKQSFDFNARNMVLAENSAIPGLSYPCFQAIIEQMRRENKYAANRVDYVCHSMGGSVLRYILTEYTSAFYRRDAASGWNYQNYRKGYTNKVITIGTPHFGSPLADIIERYSDDIPKWAEIILDVAHYYKPNGVLFDFIQPGQDGGYTATPAVHDLQITGGNSNFAHANVNGHVIGADIVPGYHYLSDQSIVPQEFIDYLENLEEALSLFEWLYKISLKDPIIENELSNIEKDLNQAQKIVKYLQIFSDVLNYGVFVPESDLVVHLKSQLAGRNRFDYQTTYVVDKVVHSPPLDLIGYPKEAASEKIADRTISMLNAPLKNGNFAAFEATPATFFKPSIALKPNTTECLVSLTIQDSARIKFLNFPAFAQTKVDSILNVPVQIFDTVGLDWAELFFQGNTYELPTRFSGIYQLDISVGVARLDTQEVTLLAHYSRNDSCVAVYQTVNVIVLPKEPLTGFEVFPDVNYLFSGETMQPGVRAVFPDGNSGESLLSASIAVSVADTSKLAFIPSTKQFLGKQPGETFAVFSYGGFQDTAYFIVQPLLEQIPDAPPPIASFAFTESVACVGGDVHLENQSLNADSFQWDFGDGESSTETSPSHQYLEPGYHQVILTATNTQTGRTANYSIAIEVEMDSIGVTIATQGDVEPCIGNSVTLVATGTPGLSYQWQINGINLADSTQPAIVVDSAGAYRVVVTNASGCTEVSNSIVLDEPCGKTISGALLHKGDGMAGVAQAGVSMIGDASGSFSPTPASGAYSLTATAGSNFTLTPQKNINLLNGVNAADVTAIQRHVANISPITNFFRLVAADVNKSYTITTFDATILNQAILGNPTALNILNNTKSWRFIPTNYNYPSPAGPNTLPVFPEKRTLTGITGDTTGLDFYGVKVGDVNEVNSMADPANKPGKQANPLILSMPDKILKAGEAVKATVTVFNFWDIAACQFAFQFHPGYLKLEQIEVIPTDLSLSVANNFGAYNLSKGELRTLWAGINGISLPAATPIFRLHFTALQDAVNLSDILRLDSSIIEAVAFDTSLLPREVQLIFTDSVLTNQHNPGEGNLAAKLQLLQNRPNPFSDGTVIGFILPESCDAQLRVLDVSGREILRIDKSYPAGYHEETIRLGELMSDGMLYYELTTPFGKLARKMTMLRR